LAALGWPLLLAVAAMVRTLRRPAQWLAAWSALPALAVALFSPDATLSLPGLLLGGSLVLDATGRWLLLAVALAWLAAASASTARLRETGFAVVFLAALAGAVWLTLAGDLPTFLAAGTLAGYSLYVILGGREARRALVVLLLIGDLIVLELLLMLAKHAAGLDFPSLREALGHSPEHDLLLILALLGFGTKAGLMGLHYWIAPGLLRAPGGLAPVVIVFMLAAGVLPWLRLLPVGGPQWPEVAVLLQWLTPAASLWALLAGLLQREARAVLGYAACGLTALWLATLGQVMSQSAARLVIETLPSATVQAGTGVGVLLLATTITGGTGRRLFAVAAAMAAALLTAMAMVGLTEVVGLRIEPPVLALLLGCPALLIGRALWLLRHVDGDAVGPSSPRAAAGLLVGLLGIAVLSASPLDLSIRQALLGAGLQLAGLAGAIAVGAMDRWLPRMPPGDLLAPISRVSSGLLNVGRRSGAQLGAARDGLRRGLLACWSADAWQRATGSGEAVLRRWPVAITLVLLLGLAVGWVAVLR
jgi:formate hydrogenlyase subunit 3/multisubunit Na+/H+ antiporter MnhD subunit